MARLETFMFFVITIGVRLLVGLSPFSGKYNVNPQDPLQAPYGDFECHRVWQAQTFHNPPELWYTNTTFSNSSYWPLDYPPLCQYTHFVMGCMTNYLFGPAPLMTTGFME